jgi:hypothetical protein
MMVLLGLAPVPEDELKSQPAMPVSSLSSAFAITPDAMVRTA